MIAEALFPAAPTVPEDVRVGVDDGGVVEERQLARQLFWQPEIVLIEEGDRFASRHPYTGVTCCTLTRVFLPAVVDAGITPCVGAGDLGTPIRRTVVDHKKLELLEGLRQHRFDRGRKMFAALIDGHDDADGRFLMPIDGGRHHRRLIAARRAGWRRSARGLRVTQTLSSNP